MFDSVYSIALSILRELGGDDTVKYDSTYSIALAILDVLGGDTTKKYDSVYSILLDIYKTRFGTDLSGMDSSYSILNEINKAFDPSDTSKYDSSYETLIAISEHMVPAGYVFEIVTDSANTVIINGEQRTSAQFETGTEVSWSVSRTGYVTQSGTYTMGEEDYSLTVTLVVDQFTYTIVPLPADATVVINEQQRSSITADYGTIITWTVSRTGYATQTGSFTLTEDRTDTIGLIANQYTLTINPTPNDATVIINGVERRSYTEDYGTAAVWSVSKAGYVTQSNIDILTSDTTRNITLVEMQYTFSIVPNPADATVMINGVEQSSVNVSDGATLTWSVSKTGYETQTGSYTIDGADHTENVTLVSTQPIITFNKGDANVKLVVNGEYLGTGSSTHTVTVNPGDSVHWEAYRSGYATRKGDLVASTSQTINTSLSTAYFFECGATSNPSTNFKQYDDSSRIFSNINKTYDSTNQIIRSTAQTITSGKTIIGGNSSGDKFMDTTILNVLDGCFKFEHITSNMTGMSTPFQLALGGGWNVTNKINAVSIDGAVFASSAKAININTFSPNPNAPKQQYTLPDVYMNNVDTSANSSLYVGTMLGPTLIKRSGTSVTQTPSDYPFRTQRVYLNCWDNINTLTAHNNEDSIMLHYIYDGDGFSGNSTYVYNLMKQFEIDFYAYGWSSANITTLKNQFCVKASSEGTAYSPTYTLRGSGVIRVWIDATHYWLWRMEDEYASWTDLLPSGTSNRFNACTQWTLVDTTA